MAKAKIVVNRQAVAHLLKQAIASDITGRAQRVAAAAGAGYEVETRVGPNRFRAEVHTTDYRSMVSEAKHHKLLRALDAGRG